MLLPRLSALHILAFGALNCRQQAQAQTPKVLNLDDQSITWSPSPYKLGTKDAILCWSNPHCTSWFEISVLGKTCVATRGNSPATVTVKFQGSAIQPFGGAFPQQVGMAGVDQQPKQNITFPSPSNFAPLPLHLFDGLDANSPHTLSFEFTQTKKESRIGLCSFEVQQAEAASNPSNTRTQSTLDSSPQLPQSTRSSAPPPHSSPDEYPQTTDTRSHGNQPPQGDPGTSGHGFSPIIPTAVTETITVNGSVIVTALPSDDAHSSGPSSAGGRHGLQRWQIALLVVGVIALCILGIVALRYWRRAGTRAQPLVQDNSPPAEVKSLSGIVALDNREVTPSTGPDYAFTRPGSSVSTWRDQHWRNSRIGVSPYLYQHPVPYPESTTDQSSHIDPVPIPARRSMLATQPLLGAAVVRQITFSTKGRVLKVQNPDFRSNASTTETETPH